MRRLRRKEKLPDWDLDLFIIDSMSDDMYPTIAQQATEGDSAMLRFAFFLVSKDVEGFTEVLSIYLLNKFRAEVTR